jgi:hypothetical protein
LGSLGLLVAIASGRRQSSKFSLIEWPRPDQESDVIVNGIAYNSVLILGSVLGQIAWTVSNSFLLTAGIGAILPFWFLKHIRLLAFPDVE